MAGPETQDRVPYRICEQCDAIELEGTRLPPMPQPIYTALARFYDRPSYGLLSELCAGERSSELEKAAPGSTKGEDPLTLCGRNAPEYCMTAMPELGNNVLSVPGVREMILSTWNSRHQTPHNPHAKELAQARSTRPFC